MDASGLMKRRELKIEGGHRFVHLVLLQTTTFARSPFSYCNREGEWRGSSKNTTAPATVEPANILPSAIPGGRSQSTKGAAEVEATTSAAEALRPRS